MERELWQALYLLAVNGDKHEGRWKYSTPEIVVVYFWAVVHDRPTSWAAGPQQWPDDLRPARLPPQSTLSRRLKQADAVELMTNLEQRLIVLLGLARRWVHVIDGKSLAVSPISQDPDAAYGRGAGGWQKGYKMHALWSGGPMFTRWVLTALSVSEKTTARRLLDALPGGGYLLGDGQYDVGYLYEAAEKVGFQLVAPKTPHRGRNGLGHRRQPAARLRSIELQQTPFGAVLLQQRNAIERHFGTLASTGGSLGPLPAWVRRQHRVRNWIQAKLIIAGLRWIKLRRPDMLADA